MENVISCQWINKRIVIVIIVPLSTQQYLKWVPGYRQLNDLVRVLSVFALWARVHSYASQEVEMVLDWTGLPGE